MAGTYVAGGSVGTLIPTTLTAIAALEATCNLQLPELQAKLAGALALQAQLTITPPSLSASLELAVQMVAALQVAITGPSIALDLTAVAALIAEIQLLLGAINVNLALALSLQALFGHAGIHLYKLENAVDGMGSDLSGLLAGGVPGGLPSDQGVAFVLVASGDPATVQVLETVFGE